MKDITNVIRILKEEKDSAKADRLFVHYLHDASLTTPNGVCNLLDGYYKYAPDKEACLTHIRIRIYPDLLVYAHKKMTPTQRELFELGKKFIRQWVKDKIKLSSAKSIEKKLKKLSAGDYARALYEAGIAINQHGVGVNDNRDYAKDFKVTDINLYNRLCEIHKGGGKKNTEALKETVKKIREDHEL